MSYKAPRKISNRARAFYPNIIKVYEYENPLTQKMEPVFKNTPAYRKDFQGETKEDVDKFLAHFVDIYTKQRDEYVKNGLKELEDGK